MTWLYQPGRVLANFCFRVLGRLEVTGQECVPPYGPLIVAVNHVSYNDPPALVLSLPRPLDFMGKKELFENVISRFLMNQFRVHPLDRSATGLDAIKTATDLLAQDRAVVLFPEGHISPEHALRPVKSGVAYLAIKTQAPILPVGIYGTEKFSPLRMGFPMCRFYVNIGAPFTPPTLEGPVPRAVVDSIMDMIMGRIAALLPEEYRGVYAFGGGGREGERISRVP